MPLARRRSITLALTLAITLATASAQAPAPAPAPPLPPLAGSIISHPGWPQPKPSDVTSVEAITNALYDVISGPKEQPRDWDRMRSLFLPDARLIPARIVPGSPSSASPNTDAIILSIDGYIARSSGRMAAEGFFERGIHNQIQQFNNIVHVWSTYESRHTAADPQPFARGINSIQLLKDGDRYWIVNIFWDSERPNFTIPQQYLSAPQSAQAAPYSNFLGDWVGQLEYRDFSSNQQVYLPTWLTVTPDADSNILHLSYTYDDGPTKTVRESSTLNLNLATAKATLSSDREHTSDSYDVQGFQEFAKLGRGTLILTGPGTENKHPVDVRITLTLRRNLYTFRKETRQPGEDFKFRDAYTFTRTQPPSL